MVKHFKQSNEERLKLKPSGKQTLISNRTGWSVTYLVKAGFLLRSKSGYFNITNHGKNHLRLNKSLTLKDLDKYPEYLNFKYGSKKQNISMNANSNRLETSTLEEMIENAYHEIASSVKN